MTADGWQFAGWSAEAGDGIYSEGEEIYSDRPVHNISAEKQAVMTEGGLTLYGQWIPVYTVTYHGNTSTGGSVPVDGSGTVYPGENIYYSGDSVTVQPAGNLEKTDADGTRYVFDGWCLNQDGSGRRLNSGDRILVEDGDVNLYAMWKTVSADRYAVNYIASLPGRQPDDPACCRMTGKNTKPEAMSQCRIRERSRWNITGLPDGH